ncbi:uncharacterized protein BO87DRAFT_208306 [Aspergillus neoniger CBS 115656]|uniref:Uncharacterized protein n=1 Tax=Aspergillus neoniger (strain CBS 115656) TaxID=1448310 RepID=A0A318YU58_ASPNB|nr:hypothetical protein BO87DRAFT_208306 [Aspergillus neoniger CBS 115656]PYH37537.1 hypothetical protein BO87DRAFT_208306 [Aspergillus neoniger CBS 115656]
MCWGRVFLSKTGIWATLRAAYLFDLFSLLFFCACHEQWTLCNPQRGLFQHWVCYFDPFSFFFLFSFLLWNFPSSHLILIRMLFYMR